MWLICLPMDFFLHLSWTCKAVHLVETGETYLDVLRDAQPTLSTTFEAMQLYSVTTED